MLLRLIYCEMLGEQVDFGLMVVMSLTQARRNIVDKRLGENFFFLF